MAKEKQTWIDEINAIVEEKAAELSIIFKNKVTPLVYVVNHETHDVAIAYLRHPDALQTLKIFRLLAENYENGIMMLVKAQLVHDVTNFEGTTSDPRFMDVNGLYLPEHSALNSTLLLDAESKLITVYRDVFKKK